MFNTVNQIHIHIYLGSTSNISKRIKWITCLYGIFILVIAMVALILAALAYIKTMDEGEYTKKEDLIKFEREVLHNFTSIIPQSGKNRNSDLARKLLLEFLEGHAWKIFRAFRRLFVICGENLTFQLFITHFMLKVTSEPEFSLDILSDNIQEIVIRHQFSFSKTIRHVRQD